MDSPAPRRFHTQKPTAAMMRMMASSDSSAITAGSTVERPERSSVRARKPDRCWSSREFWEFKQA